MSKVISAEEFKPEVLESEVPVVVDFFATWCMPCKMLAPILDEISSEAGQKAKVVKVDIDQAPQLANEYNVRSVPCLVFIKGGEVADQVVGVVPKSVIVEKLDKLIG